MANHYLTAKFKFLSYNYYYHQYLRRLSSIKMSFVRRSFSEPRIIIIIITYNYTLCIKREHAAEIFRGTCPITFALFLLATGSVWVKCITVFHLTWKALSCSRRPNVLIHVKATYTAIHHVQLHYFRTKWILWCKKRRIYREHDIHMNCIAISINWG